MQTLDSGNVLDPRYILITIPDVCMLINLVCISKFQELQSMNIVPRLKLADA